MSRMFLIASFIVLYLITCLVWMSFSTKFNTIYWQDEDAQAERLVSEDILITSKAGQ